MFTAKTKLKIAFPVAVMTVVMLLSGKPLEFCAATAAAILHELGHIVAAKLCGIHLTGLSLDLLGARLYTGSEQISYGKEAFLCAAGPFVNLVCFLLTLPCVIYAGDGKLYGFLTVFCISSGFLCLFNLLPVIGFDGGRIFICTVSRFSDGYSGETVLKVLSFICIFTLWSISVYILMRCGSSLSVFVFSVSLFTRLFVSDGV